MKKFLLSIAALLSTTLCRAEEETCPCFFALEGELLYWSPLSDNPYPARVTTGLSTKYIETFPDFNPGFRLNALYSFDQCNLFEVRFAYFNGGGHSRHTGLITFMQVSITDTGTFTDKINTRYYAADFTLHNFQCTCGPINVNFLEGIHYTWFRSQENMKLLATAYNSITNRSQVWGVGPEFGVNACYSLPNFCSCNFALAGNGRVALLAANSRIFSTSTTFAGATRIANFISTDDGKWLITPACDFRLGIDANTTCGCFNLYAEVGYEFVWYYNCLLKFVTSPFFPPETFSQGFHGPYFTLGTTF